MIGDRHDADKEADAAEPSRGLEAGIDRLEQARDAKRRERDEGSLRGQKVRGWTEKLLAKINLFQCYWVDGNPNFIATLIAIQKD